MINKKSTGKTLKIHTNLKAGGITINHVEVGLASKQTPETKNTKKTLKIHTNLKAGGISMNHVEVGLKTN